MKLQKQSLAAAILLSSTAAFAATPNVFNGESTAPITISGTIVEVVACSFGGSSQTETTPGTADGLTFEFGTEGEQYQATAIETLTITCDDTASGNSYNIAMTVAAATADYDNPSSAINVTVGTESKIATLQASEDGTTFADVDQVSTNLAGDGGSVSYSFKAVISDTGTAFGDVTADGAQNLYVKFDAEAAEEESNFDFPDIPPAV